MQLLILYSIFHWNFNVKQVWFIDSIVMKGYYIFGCFTCYGVGAIADTFESIGVPTSWVSADQIRAIVMPKGKYSQLRAKLEAQGIRVLDYKDGDIESRQAAIDTVEDVKFKTSKNTTGKGGVTYKLMAFAKDGRKYVDVQFDQNLFDGLSVPEMNALAKKTLEKNSLVR